MTALPLGTDTTADEGMLVHAEEHVLGGGLIAEARVKGDGSVRAVVRSIWRAGTSLIAFADRDPDGMLIVSASISIAPGPACTIDDAGVSLRRVAEWAQTLTAPTYWPERECRASAQRLRDEARARRQKRIH